MNRMAMASFAVVLLWLSSLAVAVSLVRYVIASPSSTALHASCSYAYDVSVEEKHSYQSCVNRQLDMCQEVYDQTVEDTLDTIQTSFDTNTALLNSIKAIQSSCSTSVTDLEAALGEWTQGGTSYTISYDCSDQSDLSTCGVACTMDDDDNSNCTCKDAQTMIGDISSVRTQAFAQASSYKTYSRSTVSSLASYADARASYDSEYIDNHTIGAQKALANALDAVSAPHIKNINISFEDLFPNAQNLVGCVSLRDAENFTGCFSDLKSAREAFEDVMSTLESQLLVAREGFQEFTDAADEYMDDVDEAVSNMVEFYEGFQTLLSATDVIDTSDLGDWFNLELSDFLVSEPVWPSGVGITSDLSSIPGANYIWNQVSGVFDAFLENMTIASVGTVKLAEAWYSDVSNLVDTFPDFSPDDYNPPEYSDFTDDDSVQNVTQANKVHEASSEKFIAESADNLNAFAEVKSEDDDDYTFDPFNFTLTDDAYNYVITNYFPFEPLKQSDIDFNVWFVSLSDITTILIIFDYVYRAYQSVYIFAKFWSRSGLRIPDIDMRIDRDQMGAVIMSNSRLFLFFATSPLLWGMVFAFLFGMFVFYVCQVYFPLYNAYVDGCVRGTTNGTFITNNLYSISYNYASGDGNDAYFNGIQDYNVQKSDLCSSYSTSSQEQQNQDEQTLTTLISSQKGSRDDMYLLSQCVDAATMDDYFLKACCGTSPYDACSAYGTDDEWFNTSYTTCPINSETGNPFDLVSSYIEDANCYEPDDWSTWALEDATFYCADIPDCALTCTGPSKELLQTTTEQCGCMFEWLIHAAWFKFTIATCIYVLMNLSRVLFTRAACKIFWKFLSPGIFTYKATCDHHGNVLALRGMFDKYESFTGPRGALKAELDYTLHRFVRAAYLEVLVALVLNGPWIAFLVLASDNIVYDPNAQDY